MDTLVSAASTKSLTPSQIDDLRLAASKMHGVERRGFQATMALKYCEGSARLAETVFGWGRQNIEVGLAEKRTGIICVGLQSAFSGASRWEEKQPSAALSLREIAESHSQQDPTFKTSLAYTRLTAASALKQLLEQGFSQEQLPAPSTMAQVLNRMGYRLRFRSESKASKKIAQTDDIFDNIKSEEQRAKSTKVKRISMDCKATVNIGDYSRGGKTRGDNQASDHDMGCTEKYVPCGIVDESSGQLHINFGSSYKTSDFIVDSLIQWWDTITASERIDIELIQIKVDNGSESSGVRTQFLNRMVELVDQINTPIHLLYYPPYHSKYNPIERCWGILEQHWNGGKLIDVEAMLSWAESMTWKGLHPIVTLSNTVYQKGISLTKKAMKQVESRLQRNPLLPKWDILIQPL